MSKTLLSAVISYLLLQVFGAVIMFFSGFSFSYPNNTSTGDSYIYYLMYTVVQFSIHFLWLPFTTYISDLLE